MSEADMWLENRTMACLGLAKDLVPWLGAQDLLKPFLVELMISAARKRREKFRVEPLDLPRTTVLTGKNAIFDKLQEPMIKHFDRPLSSDPSL